MRPAPIEVRDEDGVRWIRLRRPEKANALDAAMMQAVAGAVDGAHAGATELVALCGEGDRGFCAGADIAEFAQGVERLRAQEHALVSMIDALSRTPIPVCALVHGRALGAGGVLLTLADLAIAADDLSFGFPEIRAGCSARTKRSPWAWSRRSCRARVSTRIAGSGSPSIASGPRRWRSPSAPGRPRVAASCSGRGSVSSRP